MHTGVFFQTFDPYSVRRATKELHGPDVGEKLERHRGEFGTGLQAAHGCQRIDHSVRKDIPPNTHVPGGRSLG